ncbi:MAG: 4Fe-4S dicluster domain-containing protein [Desulfobacterales bacterium]|nr:4Fe-4S dicluster domain-containing protein [Desulfobacterales bacterium]
MERVEKYIPPPNNRTHDRDSTFLSEVVRRSGVNVSLCWHCRCCGSGCPFAADMDYLPNTILRLVQFGLKREALESSAIWICVGCHTCSMECPQAIDMAAVMDTLREMAMESGIQVGEPDILKFHNEVLKSIHRYGRTHKLEIMMRYKLWKQDWFKDLDVGLKMLSKRKLDLMPSKVRNLGKIRQLFVAEREEKKK